MTWKLQKNFWDVRYEPRALTWVLVPETIKGLFMQRVRWAQGGVEVLKKHFRIWTDTKQRRLWPVYAEYIMGILWAYSFAVLILSWLFSNLIVWLFNIDRLAIADMVFPFLPRASGSILALVCLIQFLVSIFIDRRYEKKSSLKYYFWAVWYPFIYWIISAVAIIVGVYNIFIRKSGVTVTWQSPDRGIHTLK
jgi:biofilm PGA synthesis N-glycosyltransferase PgaC